MGPIMSAVGNFNFRGIAKSHAIAATLLASIFLAGASTVSAADLEQPAQDYTSSYDWSGFYIGGVAGYNWGKDRTTEYDTATGQPLNMHFDYKPDGFSGGVKAGVNFQHGSFVYGAEADFELTNIKGGFIDRIQNLGRGDDTYDWQASLRARMGLALDRVMIYGTGGVAIADIKNTYTLVPLNIVEPISDIRAGWTAGAGVDFAVTDNLIAGIEYRFTKFNDFTNVSHSAFPGISGTQEPQFNAVRLTLSYKF